MGRLSHIDDIEQQEEPLGRQVETAAPAAEAAPEPQLAAERNEAPRKAKSMAEMEADFHGLNETTKSSGGHTALIVAAVVVVAAVVLYFANYTLHFF